MVTDCLYRTFCQLRLNTGTEMKKLLTSFLMLFTLLNTASADPLRLVTSGNLAPFTGEELKGRGMIVEIVNRVMPEAGLEHEVVFRPTWNALLSDTEEGRYQATFPWYFSEDRAQRFLYTEPLMSNYIVPFVLTAGKVRTTELEGLARHRFCRPQGYFMHDLTNLLQQPGTTLEQPETLTDCFELLKAGKVDVIPVDIFSAREAIDAVFENPNAVRRLSFVFSRQKMHILVPKQAQDAQELVDRINLALAKLELRGVLQSIRDIHANRFLRQYQ